MSNEGILIVEDEPELAAIVSRALRRHGYQILTAANGEEALGVVAENPELIELVITDIVMPGMGGRELAWRLQQLYPHIKIVLLSGYTNVDGAMQMIDPDRSTFLQKPVNLDVLAETIREVLDQPV